MVKEPLLAQTIQVLLKLLILLGLMEHTISLAINLMREIKMQVIKRLHGVLPVRILLKTSSDSMMRLTLLSTL